MAEPVWEEWMRNDVLATFCPGYSADDPTVLTDKAPNTARSNEEAEVKPVRLVRIQAGKLPNGEGPASL